MKPMNRLARPSQRRCGGQDCRQNGFRETHRRRSWLGVLEEQLPRHLRGQSRSSRRGRESVDPRFFFALSLTASMSIEVKIPAVGESISSGIISVWHKKSGEFVKAGEPLFTLETDKVSTEITAEKDGVLTAKCLKARK